MNVIIVEDEFIVAEQLKMQVEFAGHTVVAVEHSVAGLHRVLETEANVDIVLTDIRMETETCGLKIAEELNRRKIPFIFISAHSDKNTLKQSAKLNPKGYITKPFRREQVVAILTTIAPSLNRVVSLKSGAEEFRVKLDEFCYAKAFNVYSELHTEEGKLLVRMPLSRLEKHLNVDNIVRCHRSYLINTDKIVRSGKNTVDIGNITIPVSVTYSDKLKIQD